MSIMLGNLSVHEIESRLGIDFPEDIREFMQQAHQSQAEDVAVGKWHCFDMPFHMVCGDMATATKIFDSIKHRSKECKQQMAISLNTKNAKATP